MKFTDSAGYRAIVLVGGCALLGAMAVDFIAVIGRHTGVPLLGSIELVQLLVGIAGVTSLVIATLHDSHAVVRLLLANIDARIAAVLQRINAACATLFFLALAIGSAWITREMWLSHEETELLQLPIRPLRVLIVLTLLATSAMFLRKVFNGDAR